MKNCTLLVERNKSATLFSLKNCTLLMAEIKPTIFLSILLFTYLFQCKLMEIKYYLEKILSPFKGKSVADFILAYKLGPFFQREKSARFFCNTTFLIQIFNKNCGKLLFLLQYYYYYFLRENVADSISIAYYSDSRIWFGFGF